MWPSVFTDGFEVCDDDAAFGATFDDAVTFFGFIEEASADVATEAADRLVDVVVFAVAAGRTFFAALFVIAATIFEGADLTLDVLDAFGGVVVLPPEAEDVVFLPEAGPIPRAAVTGFLMCVRTSATVSAPALAPTGRGSLSM
jgi:hypothetical protein